MSKINTYTLPGVVGYRSGTYSTIPGVSLIRLKSFYIPAGTFVAGDVITIEASLSRVGNTGNFVAQIYWNETDDITNTPVLMAQNSSGVGDNFSPISRTFAIVSSTSTVCLSTSYSRPTDLTSTDDQNLNLSLSTFTTINWNIDSYIILASSNAGTVRYFQIIK